MYKTIKTKVVEENMISANYSKLLPILVKKAQELRSRVAQLKESK